MAFSLNDLPPRMQKQALAKMAEEDRQREAKQQLMEEPEAGKKNGIGHDNFLRNRSYTVYTPDSASGRVESLAVVDRGKYRSSKVTVTLPDGTEHTFDSKKEAWRYEELRLRQQAGEISDLCLQKKFVLIPAQREPDTVGKRGGVIQGKLIERECSYYADFCYTENGKTVVEDVKSPITKTPVYKVKKKLLLYVHGIRIKEV